MIQANDCVLKTNKIFFENPFKMYTNWKIFMTNSKKDFYKSNKESIAEKTLSKSITLKIYVLNNFSVAKYRASNRM